VLNYRHHGKIIPKKAKVKEYWIEIMKLIRNLSGIYPEKIQAGDQPIQVQE